MGRQQDRAVGAVIERVEIVCVLAGENAASAKIVSSYFVKADGDGNIVDSNPEMTKLRPIR